MLCKYLDDQPKGQGGRAAARNRGRFEFPNSGTDLPPDTSLALYSSHDGASSALPTPPPFLRSFENLQKSQKCHLGTVGNSQGTQVSLRFIQQDSASSKEKKKRHCGGGGRCWRGNQIDTVNSINHSLLFLLFGTQSIAPPPNPRPQHSAALPLPLPSQWRNSDLRRVRLERIGRTPLSKPLQIARAQTAQEPRASRADAKMAGGTLRPPGPRPPSSFRKAFIFLCFSTFSGANTSNCRVTPKIYT